jgi:hypothetical protein
MAINAQHSPKYPRINLLAWLLALVQLAVEGFSVVG